VTTQLTSPKAALACTKVCTIKITTYVIQPASSKTGTQVTC